MRQPPSSTDAGSFVFRPRTGLVACGLWAILGLVWLGLAIGSGWSEFLREAPLVVLISIVVYAVCGRPLVRVGHRDVLLRNVIRDVTIPYSMITAIQTQYTLTISTSDGGRHQAWAAPAGGRLGAARVTEEERKSLSWSGPVADIPASAGLRSDAGAAAVAIRSRLDAARFGSRSTGNTTAGKTTAEVTTVGPDAAGPDAAGNGDSVQVTWARGVLRTLLLAVAAAVAVWTTF